MLKEIEKTIVAVAITLDETTILEIRVAWVSGLPKGLGERRF